MKGCKFIKFIKFGMPLASYKRDFLSFIDRNIPSLNRDRIT